MVPRHLSRDVRTQVIGLTNGRHQKKDRKDWMKLHEELYEELYEAKRDMSRSLLGCMSEMWQIEWDEKEKSEQKTEKGSQCHWTTKINDLQRRTWHFQLLVDHLSKGRRVYESDLKNWRSMTHTRKRMERDTHVSLTRHQIQSSSSTLTLSPLSWELIFHVCVENSLIERFCRTKKGEICRMFVYACVGSYHERNKLQILT